jgi:hypothetical protein
MRLKSVCVLVSLLGTIGCGDNNPPMTPSPPDGMPLPTFQGQYAGTYVTSGCTETSPGGLCTGLGFNVSRTLSLTLTLDQHQRDVTGTIGLGVTSLMSRLLGSLTMSGAFQGLIQSSGHLTGSATMNTSGGFCLTAPADPGLPGGGGYAICVNNTASAWDTTVAGNALDGSFTLVFSASRPAAGTATVSATLLGVTRQ